jgi:hypothetical protein
MIAERGKHQRECGEMAQPIQKFGQFEGRQVSVALADGSRIDDCGLVSAGRGGARTMWVLVDGLDVFIRQADVVAVWEAAPERQRSAA